MWRQTERRRPCATSGPRDPTESPPPPRGTPPRDRPDRPSPASPPSSRPLTLGSPPDRFPTTHSPWLASGLQWAWGPWHWHLATPPASSSLCHVLFSWKNWRSWGSKHFSGDKVGCWSLDRLGPCQVSEGPGTASGRGCACSEAPAHPHPQPHLLTSLAVPPGEVFWTDAAWATWHVHTGASLLARVVCAAVV